MRSVHTAASVHSHCGGTSLPCLAKGTPGSLICSCVSFTLPPSCPPSLHGRYPLHRSYEGSDSCSAPLCTRTGILGSCTDASGHSVSTHVIRPCASDALALAQAWPRFALVAIGGSSDFVHYPQSHQSYPAVSSSFWESPLDSSVYGLSFHFQLLSTSPRGDAVTFRYWRLAPPERDFHPPPSVHSQAHGRGRLVPATFRCDKNRGDEPSPPRTVRTQTPGLNKSLPARLGASAKRLSFGRCLQEPLPI